MMKQDSFWSNIFPKRTKNMTLEVIKSVPLFEGLNQSEFKEIEKIVHHRHYAKGETIFEEEEPGMGMYIIKSGKIKITTKVNDTEKELAMLGEYDLFGELALLDESPRSATATAIDKTELIAIFRPDFFDLINRNTHLGLKVVLKLAQMIGMRLRIANERVNMIEVHE